MIQWVEIGRDISLYKFCDIYLFVNRYGTESFCNEIEKGIWQYGLQKECYYAFFHTRELFDIQNKAFDNLIHRIRPDDVSFMNEIIVPGEDRIYTYTMDFQNWIFCSNRKGYLHEITHVTSYT